MSIAGNDAEPPLSILVAPFDPSAAPADAKGPRITLMITVQGREPLARTDVLKALYGVTNAEALVLAKLVRGLSAKEIATAHRVSVNTVRNQIQRLMEKTMTRRQADLIARVLTDGGTLFQDL